MTVNCRRRWPMIQSTRMAATRLRRAGVLLLVLWLTADVAAFGFCNGPLAVGATGSTVIAAADSSGDGASCCSGHHCFCCSSGAEATTFDLSVEAVTAIVTPQPSPNTPDFVVSNTSPPPRS